MSREIGKNTIAGAWGTLRIDNQDVAEVTGVDISITADREDIQWGIGKDSKIISLTGEGTLTLDHVYSRFMNQIEQFKKGKDVRFDLALKYADPDSVGGQIETFSISGAWLNTLNNAFDKTAKNSREYTFGFNVLDSSYNDKIK